MVLFRYFQHIQPTAREKDLKEALVQAANAAMFQDIQNIMDKTGTRKRKVYTAFAEEWRAAIGKYASENGNAAAVTHKKVTSHCVLLHSFALYSDMIISGHGFSHAVAKCVNKLHINLNRG